MNYEFARPVTAWCFYRKLKITPSELDHRLRDLRAERVDLVLKQDKRLVVPRLGDRPADPPRGGGEGDQQYQDGQCLVHGGSV